MIIYLKLLQLFGKWRYLKFVSFPWRQQQQAAKMSSGSKLNEEETKKYFDRVQQQGDAVRKLKSEKASKDDVTKAVEVSDDVITSGYIELKRDDCVSTMSFCFKANINKSAEIFWTFESADITSFHRVTWFFNLINFGWKCLKNEHALLALFANATFLTWSFFRKAFEKVEAGVQGGDWCRVQTGSERRKRSPRQQQEGKQTETTSAEARRQ